MIALEVAKEEESIDIVHVFGKQNIRLLAVFLIIFALKFLVIAAMVLMKRE
jgi:hypothetical protein